MVDKFLSLVKSKLGCGYVWGAPKTFDKPEIITAGILEQYKRTFGASHYTTADKWIGKEGFDCSGLIVWALADMGLNNKDYTALGLYSYMCNPISKGELQPGDLCFRKSSTIDHVAVYVGNGRVIHARGSFYGVVETALFDSFNLFGRLKCLEVELSMVEKVKEFQRRNKLVVDGIIGAKTKAEAQKQLEIVNYILNYKEPPKEQIKAPATVEYKKVAITDIMYVNPLDLRFAKVNKQSKDISYKHFVNGMQFGSKDGKVLTIGTGYSEGKKITARLSWDMIERGTFIIHRDGSVTVEQMIDPDAKYQDIWFCVQNVGLNPIDLKAEWWPDSVGRVTNRIAIGYNPTTKKVVLTHRPDSNMQRARETLANLGCVQGSKVLGIVLDSGTPATFKCNGIYYRNGGYMDNVIYID